MPDFGELIRHARGDTLQKDLAERVGVKAGYLSRIERGNVPPPSDEICSKLESVLGFAPGELVARAHLERAPTDVQAKLSLAEELRREEKAFRERIAQLVAETNWQRSVQSAEDAWQEIAARLDRELEAHYQGRPPAEQELFLQAASEAKESFREAVLSIARGFARLRKEERAGIDLDQLWADGTLKQWAEERSSNIREYLPLGRPIPLINKVSAGYPREFTDLGYPVGVAEDYVYAPGVTDERSFAIEVCGESMEPQFKEGDVLVISPEAAVKSGDDCFVKIASEDVSTLKRVYFEDGDEIRLQPLNPKYASETYRRSEIAACFKVVCRMEYFH